MIVDTYVVKLTERWNGSRRALELTIAARAHSVHSSCITLGGGEGDDIASNVATD